MIKLDSQVTVAGKLIRTMDIEIQIAHKSWLLPEIGSNKLIEGPTWRL